MQFFEDYNQDLNKELNISNNKLSISRAIISLLLYFFVISFVGSLSFVVLHKVPEFNEQINETDGLIETLFTKNAVGIVEKHELYTSIYDTSNLDVHDLNYEYVLISSNGVFTEKQKKDLNEEFIKNLFEEEDYYNNGYQVYRILPLNLDEEIFSLYGIENPQFEYQTKEVQRLNSLGSAIQNFSLYFILLIGLLIVVWEVLKKDFLNFTKSNKYLKAGLIGVLLIYAGNFVGSMIRILLEALFQERVIESLNQISIVNILQSRYSFIIIFTVVIMGPLVEEIVFRKTFFSFFKNKKAAIIVSSLAFGLIHVLGETSLQTILITLIPYLVPGLVFGYIYAKNDENIIVPIVSHVILNAVSVILILLIN